MGRQYPITISGEDYYIDLLMYNAFMNRYMVIELKNTEFKPEYIGKLNFYCSAVDDVLCREGDNITMVTEGGANLSQGEKQLLCIARIILLKPNMLILDEATSNIDTRTELKIQESFDNLMEGRTCFIVAHRLSTITNADKILVMNKGNVIEQGTHKELLEKKGFYFNLYNSQFANKQEDEE